MWRLTTSGRGRLLVVSLFLAASRAALPTPCWSSESAQAEAGKAPVQERLNRVRTELFSRPDRIADAIGTLKGILAAEPRSAEAHLLLGIAYRMQGSPEFLGEAVAELRQALELNPGYVPARYYLAQLYLQLGRAERARQEMEAALTHAPKHPQFLGVLAEAERQLGNPRRSVELTREALQADASFAEARYYLGLALFDLGKRNEAIQEFERVVQSGPPLPEPYLSLGTAYLEAGRVDDALATLNQGSKMNPSRTDIRIQLARAYRMKGLLDRAEAQLKRAVPGGNATLSAPFAEQTEFDFFQEQGLLRLQQKRLAEAGDMFRKLLEMDPDHGPTNRHLAEVYLQQGSYRQALEHATRAEKLGFPLASEKRDLLDAQIHNARSGKRK